jgi:hydrogenase maturation protease
MKRVLVAGVGNVLRGDDGLGIRALDALRASSLAGNPSVRFWESGIAGIGLVQELMDGYDALVVIDALDRREAAAGEVFVIEPDLAEIRSSGGAVDLHDAKPEGVLRLAAAMGTLPPRVFIVGAQIASCDELTQTLSPALERALGTVVERVVAIVRDLTMTDLELTDEILQILFWLQGEGIAEHSSARDLDRWVSVDESAIARVLSRMHDLGLVERVAEDRFRLTSEGKREGGRRFADEFSDMTKPGHGECGDPDCECQESGDPADCRHVAG